MTASDQLGRTIEACRRAGLPVIDDTDCTCRLRGQLVVLARLHALRLVWPYNERCPIQDHALTRCLGEVPELSR
jgi:hypothetical protein